MRAVYDPFDYAFHSDPYPAYKQLRDEHPVYRVEKWGFWVVSRYDDCLRVLTDEEHFSSSAGNVIDDPPERVGLTLGTTDRPRHDELQQLVVQAYTPARVRAVEPRVRQHARGLLAAFPQHGAVDVVRGFSAPLTARVMGEFVGIPPQDHERFRRWREAWVHREHGRMGLTPQGREALREQVAYMRELVAQRRATPQDDLVSAFLAAEVNGRRMQEDEIVVTSLTVLGAGYQSINWLLTKMIAVLARYPGERRRLVREPRLIGQAIEEALRYDSEAQAFARVVKKDVVMHGKLLREGERVLVLLGSGNRDERRFPNPDVFDIERDTRGHLGFGMGTHYCLGASLGRLVVRIAVEEFLMRLPEYDVDWSSCDHIHSPTFSGYSRLVVTY